MAYRFSGRRRLGVDTTYLDLSSLPTAPPSPGGFDLLGILADAVQGTENTVNDALTGNLTASQVATIKANGNATIAQAAGGNAALAAQQQAAWNAQLAAVVAAGYNSGPSNLLADLGAVSAPGGSTPGLLGWLETNWLLVFGATAAFVVFRPDKILFGRR